MNTDKLRETWKSFPDNILSGKDLSEEDILNLMKKNADLSLKRFKRSIYFEVVLSLLAMIIIVFSLYHLADQIFFRVLQLVIILIIIGYFVFVGIFYNKLNSISISIDNLRNSLQEKIRLLDWFIKTYFWINLILAPIVFPLGIFTGYILGKSKEEPLKIISFGDPAFFKLLGITLLMLIVFYPFLKWYTNKLYGRHVKELEKSLSEITNLNGNNSHNHS